jgi:D-sedoheptulose 7-phosphate isomerase
MKRQNSNELSTTPNWIRSPQYYFELHQHVLSRLPFGAIEQAAEILLESYELGRTVFLFGNGGSAALASHLACDLAKGTLQHGNAGQRFRVMALTDNIPLITAWANDSSYDAIFAEQLLNFVVPGDIALAISGSGNSPNVLRALEAARTAGACTIGLTGFQGGKMKQLCDHCIVVPSDNMQVIEDFHLSVSHALFSVIRDRISSSPTRFAAAAAVVSK